jgi:hypothetical protein
MNSVVNIEELKNQKCSAFSRLNVSEVWFQRSMSHVGNEKKCSCYFIVASSAVREICLIGYVIM